MSKTKKAVIIGSVLVGIGVIIGFIGIAIGGFRFPNGEVDLTTMKALHTEKKTVQIADAFDKIEIAGASSMDIEICKSKTGKNYVEYYDTDDWTSHVDVKDHVLKFTTDDKGKHKAIVSLGFGKDTAARLYLADAEYKEIAVTTSSGDVDMEITAGRTYRFETKTNSGDVDVPDGDADSGYLCKIVTSSGDVDVKQK